MNENAPINALAGAPRHVAIIMDGNGRWAKAHHVPRKIGHKQGVEAVRRLVRAVRGSDIKYLTLYGFSSENWSRPPTEINDLMGLLRLYIRRDLVELRDNGVCIRIVGEREGLASDLIELIEEAEETTKHNCELTLVIAFNYGGRDEITRAVRSLVQAANEGKIKADEITAHTLATHLYAPDVPDPDLVIRTSGEQRLSNFLTWQSAYSELVFVPTLWPEFGEADLMAAIAEYHKRDRRFGGRPDETKADHIEPTHMNRGS